MIKWQTLRDNENNLYFNLWERWSIVLQCLFEDDMVMDIKKLYQSVNILGTLSLAMTLPVIVYRVLKAVYLKKGYNALSGKVRYRTFNKTSFYSVLVGCCNNRSQLGTW